MMDWKFIDKHGDPAQNLKRAYIYTYTLILILKRFQIKRNEYKGRHPSRVLRLHARRRT
jgi:hypothetical protein